MPYVRHVPSVRVNLKSNPDYWVQWKPIIKYGDVKAAAVASVQVDERGRQSMDNATAADRVMLAHIEDWNLDDEEGKKLPVTAESLSLLEDQDIDILAGMLNQEEEKESAKRKN